MKRRHKMLGPVLLLALALVATLAGPASAQETRVPFTTDSQFAGVLNPGDLWWSSDVYHVDGLVMRVLDASSYSGLSGVTTIWADVVGSPNPFLPIWANSHGRWRTETAAGVWEGTETSRSVGGSEYYRAEGRGVTGSVVGYEVHWTGVASLHGPVSITGFVIEH